MLNRLSSWFGARPKAMATEEVKLPPDLPNWSVVKELLQNLQGRLINENISDQEAGWFMQTVYSTIQSDRRLSGARDSVLSRLRQQIQSNVKKKLDHNCLWFGMLKYLRKASREEKDKFLYSTLPNIIELALGIENCRPAAPLHISRQQHGSSTKLSRQFVCSIVACFFLCLFPERKRDSCSMNIINFANFFKHLPHPAQIAKLRCVLHYFECVIDRGIKIQGNICFCRKVASSNSIMTFDELVQCDLKLCPLSIHHRGKLEDSGSDTIHVCFGNKSVGGGVLGRSRVQEEICFSTCPELMAAMLFMENMDNNEAIQISGIEQFSSYFGYGDSLEFAGHFSGSDPIYTVVTIDATSFKDSPMIKQYEESSILRDLNKAVIGFSSMSGDPGQLSGLVVSGDESSGAVDVAADVVTTAMTDALHQAADSSVDPDPLLQQLSSHEQLSQSCRLSSTTNVQESLNLQQFSSATESIGIAESSVSVGQNVTESATSCSGDLQTAQSKVLSACPSLSSPLSSSSNNTNVSVESSLDLQLSSSVHSTGGSSTTASSCSAQNVLHASHSLYVHRHQQPDTSGQEEKCTSFPSHLPPSELFTWSHIAASSSSEKISQNAGNFELGVTAYSFPAESSALVTQGEPVVDPAGHSWKLTSDILGNLTRTASPTAAEVSVLKLNEYQLSLHSIGRYGDGGLAEQQQKSYSSSVYTAADIVIDVSDSPKEIAAESVSLSTILNVGTRTAHPESAISKNAKALVESKCEDIVDSLDVVLSLPAFHSELERVGSGLSNSSMFVNIDSQSLSTNSAEEENNRQLVTEALFVNVENIDIPFGSGRHSRTKMVADARASSADSMLPLPPLSSSPQSSISSANISPNTSFLVPEPYQPEPLNGSNDVHVTADFFISGLDGSVTQARQPQRRGSRDFYGELRDFLSSSSSGSRGSGSGGPLSSTNSSWGSRSGSISSHGTNGSTIDFLEFWSHFRRRSSQLSDTMSRRSSSSKHSSDFSTDLEEISESVQKHNHGIIEEEGGLISLVTDFAAQFASMAVRNGVAKGAHLTCANRHSMEGEVDELSYEYVDEGQPFVDVEEKDSIYHEIIPHIDATAKTEKISVRVGTLSRQDEVNLEIEDMSFVPSNEEPTLSRLGDKAEKGLNKFEPACRISSSPTMTSDLHSERSASKTDSMAGTPLLTSLSHSRELFTSPRIHQFVGQQSSSHSLDSGISTNISSVTLASEHKTTESLMQEVGAYSDFNSSVSVPQPFSVHDISQVAGPISAPESWKFERKAGESGFEASKQSIPFSQTDCKTMYATLESKTIYLNPENFPQLSPAGQTDKLIGLKEPEYTTAELIPFHCSNQQQTRTCETSETVEPHYQTHKYKSHIPRSISTESAEVKEQGHKYFRRAKTKEEVLPHSETLLKMKNHVVSEASITAQGGAASTCHSSASGVSHPASGAAAHSKSSGIPKFKDGFRRSSREYSLKTEPFGNTCKPSHEHHAKDRHKSFKDKKQKDGASSSHKNSSKEADIFKPHKSRYLFSDVAAPLCSRKKEMKSDAHEMHVKKLAEKKTSSKKHSGRSRKHDPLSYTRSPKFVRFVNSIAEMAVSQAVLEGAETVAQVPSGHIEISDELYNWFAGKIVTEVFSFVIGELGVRETDRSPEAFQVSPPLQETRDQSAFVGHHSYVAIKKDMSRAEASVLKLKSILPTRSDIQTSAAKAHGQPKSLGSMKVVKFIDSHGDNVSNLQAQMTLPSSSKTGSISTFHRQSSSIPGPIRRRSSLDLPSSSAGAYATSLYSSRLPLSTSPQWSQAPGRGQDGTTSANLSIDIYQAAAAIVNQVFQAVSNSWDAQSLSPASSGPQGAALSSDTGTQSTGNRAHSHYDSVASSIFASSSVIVSESPKRTQRSVSPSFGVFSRKPMSRETLTNAFLKVDSRPSLKSYERRSSEPCQTSVQLSLQAFNNIKFNKQAVEDKQKKISLTDDDIGRGRTWRRSSLDGFPFERRNSCGFKDPVLSRFAEELMKADTSVPELVIVGSHASSSSTGSRRSSLGAYRDITLVAVDSELLNTSFTSVCSLPVSQSSQSQSRRPCLDRSRSRESRTWKSDSSDTEYWFPPPKFVGNEFQQEYNRQHSQDELHDYATFFAGRIVQEAVCVLKCDPTYRSKEEQDVDIYAENLTDQIIRDALVATIHGDPSHFPSSQISDGSRQKSSTLRKVFALKKITSNNTDAEQKYYGEGARPKTFFASKAKDSSQKKETKGGSRQDHRPAEKSRHYQEGRNTSYAGSQPTTAVLKCSRRGSSFHQNVQKITADLWSYPSKLKRHSTAGTVPPPSITSSSLTKPFSAPHSASGTGPHYHQPQEKGSQRARSKSESASSTASGIPIFRGSLPSDPAHLKRIAKTKRVDSQASSASSVSSYHSEQTGSSLLSSSGSESIGPTGRDTPPRKPISKREKERRSKTFYKGDLTGSDKERSRRGDAAPRKTEALYSKRKSAKNKAAHPVIDRFATSLSIDVVRDAMQHCRNLKWHGFLSYQKPIATGNWGCGAFRGNAQLKLVIQWIAASVAQAPSLMYYTFNDRRMTQAEEVAHIIAGQTVAHLAAALRDYCNWVRLNLASSSSFFSSARMQLHLQPAQQSSRSYSTMRDDHDSRLPQSLFDFLLQKFRPEDK